MTCVFFGDAIAAIDPSLGAAWGLLGVTLRTISSSVASLTTAAFGGAGACGLDAGGGAAMAFKNSELICLLWEPCSRKNRVNRQR